jgi:hypothetical protein
MSTTSFTRKELESYADQHVAFYGLDLSRISSILLAQLYDLEKKRVVNIFNITQEIKYLEGLHNSTLTGKAEPFKKEPLRGLYKKHFTDARFIIKNIGNHLGYGNDKTPRLDKIINNAFSNNKSGCVDSDFINYISYHTTIGAYDEKAKKRLTGEWIVFQKHNSKNYYLTMGAHNEGDNNILKRVNDAYMFDFLFLHN